VLYRIVVHAPAYDADDGSLTRLRRAMESRQLEIADLRRELGPHDNPLFRIESTLEAPSSYHASVITGPQLFAEVFEEAGVPMHRGQVVVEAVRPT
jgi:hypothetical protein